MCRQLPAAWKSFVSCCQAILSHSRIARWKQRSVQGQIRRSVGACGQRAECSSAFAGMRVDDLVECDTFLAVDQGVGKVAHRQTCFEDIGAIVNGFTIPELCENGLKCTLAERLGRPISCFLQCVQHGEGSGLPCRRWLSQLSTDILLLIT